jgi:hypothetical protein
VIHNLLHIAHGYTFHLFQGIHEYRQSVLFLQASVYALSGFSVNDFEH